ncbi:hypothetical protein Sru01_54630 [Sphaerisporangium rufum]|uniref:Cellulose binding domain-containing protein n=1 Tax=Sphaerisporangium rufum TaxID=1381558 RepID=A0A919R6A5_9ACTN|nr:cellulose binding domain-containing protein [Sphaerisporangium rufum]GII80481.1 hypothetical protein Sru01_54630 [Sphaerisporangium rufum]
MRSIQRLAAVAAAALALAAVPVGSAQAMSLTPAGAAMSADVQPPSPPTGLWVCGADFAGAVPFCWTASTDDVGVVAYDVYRKDGDTFVKIGTNQATDGRPPQTLYVASGLVPGQWYTFQVVARDAAGNASAPSAPLTAQAEYGLPVPTPTPTPTAGPSCKVGYRTQDWSTGFTGYVDITNTGKQNIDGWRLNLRFPGEQKVAYSWGATFVQTASDVTFTGQSWNSVIGAGKTVSFGFTATNRGVNAPPESFSVNGSRCTTA